LKQKEVVIYSPYLGTRSHAESYTWPACDVLAQRGRFKPIVVSCGAPSGTRKAGYEIVTFPLDYSTQDADRYLRFGPLAVPLRGISRVIMGWAALRQLRRFLTARPSVDLVHFLDYEYLTLSRFINASPSGDPKLIVTVHQSDYSRQEKSWRSVYKRMVKARFREALSRCSGIIVHGDFIKDRLVSELQPTAPIYVAQYPQGNLETRIDKAEARRRLGIPEHEKVSLVFGLLRVDKRPDIAIQACGSSASKPYVIVAGNPWTVSAEQIHEWIDRAGLRERSRLDLRWLNDQEILLYYSAADLLLSTHEPGFVSQSGPLSMCRAFRLPAVVADTGEIGDYVRRSGVGLLAHAGDSRSFAQEIDRFFEQEATRHGIFEALEKAAQTYSWDHFVDQWEACYTACLDPDVVERSAKVQA